MAKDGMWRISEQPTDASGRAVNVALPGTDIEMGSAPVVAQPAVIESSFKMAPPQLDSAAQPK